MADLLKLMEASAKEASIKAEKAKIQNKIDTLKKYSKHKYIFRVGGSTTRLRTDNSGKEYLYKTPLEEYSIYLDVLKASTLFQLSTEETQNIFTAPELYFIYQGNLSDILFKPNTEVYNAFLDKVINYYEGELKNVL